jgi:hypothetical protein
MADYADIYGKRVKELTNDPTLTSSYEGQVWYNENSGTLRSLVEIKAWSSGGNLNKGRYELGGVGTQTAGLAFGGNRAVSAPTGLQTDTEEYSGYSWSTGGALPAAKATQGFGTQTAAVACGGTVAPNPTAGTSTEEYNGSAWTAGGALNTATVAKAASTGIESAGLKAGGGSSPSARLNNVEEYNGSSWTSVTNLPEARFEFQGTGPQTAAFFTGGNTSSTTETTDSFDYDGTNWTSGPTMPFGIRLHGVSGNSNTANLSFGGEQAPGGRNLSVFFDGSSFTSDATLGTGRNSLGGFGASKAAVACGGNNAPSYELTATEEYSSSINTITQASWASGGALNTGRYGLRGTGTQTAMVVAGGNIPPNSNTAATEEYNGSSWTNSTSLPAVIQDGNMTGTETASIYAGGTINPGSYPGNTNAYNGSSWTSGGNMNTDVAQYGLTGTSTAAVAFGGYIGSGPGRTADVQNYNGSSWTANPTSLPALRGLLRTAGTQTATFMAGGNAPPGPQPVTSFSYDGSSFSSEADSLVGMNDHGAWGTATAAYFMGGDQPTGTGGTGPKAVATFYYNGTSWTSVTSMTAGRSSFGWSKSPNAAGLVSGGNGPSAHLTTTEEFTEGSETITAKTLTTS